MADNLDDDEIQEFLGEIRVELGGFGQLAQAGDLDGFPAGVGGGQPVGGLIFAHRFGALEPFSQEMDQCGIDIIDGNSRSRASS